MPQLNGGDGDDLGANDELIAFKDEGEQEEKRNVSAERDLDDVKSSLVNESETNSSSDSEVSLVTGARNVQNQLFLQWSSFVFLIHSLHSAHRALFTCLCVVCVQADRRPKPGPDLESRARHSQLVEEGMNTHSSLTVSLNPHNVCFR